MKRICVFCGASPGIRPEYREAAKSLGHACVHWGLEVVYGGARVGLMGCLADTVLEQGGRVIGVIPSSLVDREVAHGQLSDLRVVSTMHERKSLMAELADAFVAMPGGLGTIEEFLEVLTWNQLGIIHRPCGLLNVSGYFDPFLRFLDHAAAEQFMRPEHRDMLRVHQDPRGLLKLLEHFRPQEVDKAQWVLSMNGIR